MILFDECDEFVEESGAGFNDEHDLSGLFDFTLPPVLRGDCGNDVDAGGFAGGQDFVRQLLGIGRSVDGDEDYNVSVFHLNSLFFYNGVTFPLSLNLSLIGRDVYLFVRGIVR